MTRPLLIAGIGNLFLGDDAFGCEVTRRLRERYPRPPEAIELRDFGIGVRALGYVLAARSASGNAGMTVIVDAVATGAAPGTVQLFDLAAGDGRRAKSIVHHAQGIEDALATALALGARLERTYLLGCEPASFEPAIGASAATDGRLLTLQVDAAAQRCVGLLGRMMGNPDQDLVTLCQNSQLDCRAT
jgi:hydrogenase maturation protease